MKKTKIFSIALLFLAFFQSHAKALEVPDQPLGRVHDAANILETRDIVVLTQELFKFEQETSNQIVVATFPSLEGESLEDFSIRLAEKWKIGQKDKDNGIILLVFPNDRKLRIEVGYGLEGWVPDILASQIIEKEIKPYFKEGKYYLGIQAGVDALIKATQGAYQADSTESNALYGKTILGLPLIAFFVLLFFVLGFAVIIFLANFTSLGLPNPNSPYITSSDSSSYSSSGSSSSSSDSFSGGSAGGGGSFGGGGSSGSW